MSEPRETALNQPRSLLQLFLAFNRLALQGFGGVLPIAQRELVERQRWLTAAEFTELLSIGQVLPGPNVVNLALMVGDRYFGWRGAMTSVMGMLLVPLALVLLLAALYQGLASQPQVAGAVRGMGLVSAGLVVAMGLKLLPTLRRNPLPAWQWLPLSTLTVVAIVVWRWPLAQVILAVGVPACLLAARHLHRMAASDASSPPQKGPAP